MLSKILDKSTCAECRFCCSFRRCSLWETPLFPIETVEKLKGRGAGFDINEYISGENGEKYSFGRMNLIDKYKTFDDNEEAGCDYLDCSRGCILSDEDKPFDCKIWPLRVMRKKDKLVIALTPTCPAVNRVPFEELQSLVRDELADIIFEYAKKYPFVVKDYREGFPVVLTRDIGK